MRLKNIPALLLILQLTLGSFAPFAPKTYAINMDDTAEKTVDGGAGDATVETTPKGLRFRLSEGAEQSERPAPQPVAQAVKLSESETARVLQRLPPLKEGAGDEQEFALRERSLPAPRAGATVLNAFPSADERKAPDEARGGELQILRYSPQGDVPLAPQVSVTFSQPMVAVTSQEEAARSVPATLAPQPAGRWRWLGTKTLIFDPEGQRLPMATEFTVAVPAGTRSANGGATRASVVWKFSTPPPKLTRKYPEDIPVRRDAIIFMEFDQRVEPDAVLRALRVRSGASALKVRLASDVEINADENVKRLVKDAVKGRWLALRAVNEGGGVSDGLPADSAVSVTVVAGTPSAEGPRTTTVAQEFSFRTYGALRVTEHQCGWNKTCTPFDQWRITFSNPLDMEAFDQTQVKIEPEVPDAKVAVYGQTMYVSGAKRGRTTYKVTLDRALRDTFGQTLAPPVSVTFNVGPAPPSLTSAGGNFVVLEPTGASALSVYSVNQPSLKVSLYAVGAEDFERYVAYMKSAYGYYDARQKQKQTAPPGTLVYTKTVQPTGQPDEMTETRIDLAPALKNGEGNVFVMVEPSVRRQDREILRRWVEVTSIGLDAFVDRDELVGWATSLRDGQPLEGVEMMLKDSGARGVTGADGLVRLQLPPKSDATTGLLLARKGNDAAFLPERGDWWSNQTGWVRRDAQDELRCTSSTTGRCTGPARR